MNPAELCAVLEAILLASGVPLSIERLRELFDEQTRPEPVQIREALEQLEVICEGRGFELVEVASGFRLQIRARFAPWMTRLSEERAPRYSRALLETLALIAWRGPITRGEIEDIRGVAVSSSIIKTLQERQWISVVGQRDVPGKPELLGTTKQFLDHFNLKSLAELPLIEDLPHPPSQPEENIAPEPPPRSDLERSELSFKNLLAELDNMEQNLKTDFEDLSESESD